MEIVRNADGTLVVPVEQPRQHEADDDSAAGESAAAPAATTRVLHPGEGGYDEALGELRRGRKTTHWMWFVFPQIAGLGHSAMSRRFAISSRVEAVAYVAHPVLGPRLVACAEVVARTRGRTVEQIFGAVD